MSRLVHGTADCSAAIEPRTPPFEALSLQQQALYTAARAHSAGAPCLARAMRLRGDLELAPLQRLIDAHLARHAQTCPTSFVDLSSIRSGYREVRLHEQLRQDRQHAAAAGGAPLIAAKVYRLSPREHVLSCVAHPLLWDERSFDILLRKLVAAAGARGFAAASSLPKAGHYDDYVRRQRRWLGSESADSQKRYWLAQLAGSLRALELTTGRPRPVIEPYVAKTACISLRPNEVQQLRALGERTDTHLSSIVLAVFDVLLWQWTGQEELLLAKLTDLRTTPWANVLGRFENPIALRMRVTSATSFLDLLRHVSQVEREGERHRQLPLEWLVRELALPRGAAGTSLLRASYSYREDFLARSGDGLTWSRLRISPASVVDDLSLRVVELDAGIECAFDYASELLDSGTIDTLVARLRNLLASVCAAPERPIGELAERADATPAGARDGRLAPVTDPEIHA